MKKLLLLLSLLFISQTQAVEKTAPSAWDQVLELSKGNLDFKNFDFPKHEKEYLQLAEKGQHPRTLFIGCSDSRVVPELITRANPGDLFVIRCAGNFVPPYNTTIAYDGIAATIQYGVEALGVTTVIICGHSHCGAIQALFKSSGEKLDFVTKWLQFGQEAKELSLKLSEEHLYTTAEKLSVIFQMKHLMTYPFIRKLVEEKKLFIHGWYYSIETGTISYFDPDTDNFHPLNELKKS